MYRWKERLPGTDNVMVICDVSWGNVSGKKIGRYAGLWKGGSLAPTRSDWKLDAFVARLQDVIF
jgi:hypothetical protein